VSDESSELLSCRGIQVRVGTALRLAQVAGFFVAGVLLLSGRPTSILAGLAVACLPVWIARSQRLRAGGLVALVPGGLRLQGVAQDRFVPSARVVGGHVAPNARSVVLRVANGSEIRLELERDEAARVFAHVGMGVGQRALVAPLRRMVGAFTIGFVTVFVTFMLMSFVEPWLPHGHGGWDLLLALMIPVVATVFAVRRFGYPRVVVGSDGVRIEGGLVARFVPYAAIRQARAAPRPREEIALRCKSGETVRLAMISRSRDEREALLARIVAGMEAYAPTGEDRLAGVLERGGRSIAEWKEDLRRLTHVERGFREQPLGRSDFERVVADPSAPPDRRVGAALALRALDAHAAPRVRVAAEASAHEGVRGLLEAASEGEVDEEALAEAMAGRQKS
jgi:hypothetical protein